MTNVRRMLLGRRLSSVESHHNKVSNVIGLSVFSSDALSSVAYATQEIMASLSGALLPAAGAGATGYGPGAIQMSSGKSLSMGSKDLEREPSGERREGGEREERGRGRLSFVTRGVAPCLPACR